MAAMAARHDEPAPRAPARPIVLEQLSGNHLSDAAIQRSAEAVILAKVAEHFGVDLSPKRLVFPSGAQVEIDGASSDDSILVEVFARQGALKGGQQRKVCQDALKLITLGRSYPGARLVLAFADAAAAAYASRGTWVAEALKSWGVNVLVVEVEEAVRAEIRDAQLRQVMVNPSAPPAEDAVVMAAGVDGCRGGWIAAMAFDMDREALKTRVHLFKSIADVCDWHADYGSVVVGIDVPIGLPELVGLRPCDREARKRLGPRWMSVFEVPDRELFGHDFETAREIVYARRGADPGRKFTVLTQQAIAMMPRIAEVDHIISREPELEHSLIEVHPEVSFRELSRRALPPKRTPEGAGVRLELLRAQFPDIDAQLTASRWPKTKVALDDILDAYVVLWSALRFTRGEGHYVQLGGGERDSRGVTMRMIA